MDYFAVVVFGLIIGSFLNVCIYRLPEKKSIVTPSSFCPKCGIKIKPWDNIPILSYLFLIGRCRSCGERISLRYPFVELLNGLFYLFSYMHYGLTYHLFFIFIFLSSMIVITFIDIDYQIIPDSITLPGIIVGLFAGSFFMPDPFSLNLSILGFKDSFLGFLIGGISFYLIAIISRGGMGGGDIKMMAMIGAFLGWKSVFLTTLIGSVFGSLLGIFLMIFKGKGRKTKIPFGPFLALGSIITLFFGRNILDWYLNISI